MPNSIKGAAKRIGLSVSLLAAMAFLIWGSLYLYDKSGGISDQRLSHAMGAKYPLHIPLGKTPQDAVQKFRHSASMDVIYREPVSGGAVLFIKGNHKGSGLHVEYARKTWLGWKWRWGGSFGTSQAQNSALSYMCLSETGAPSTPFPMVYGNVLDSSIDRIMINAKGKTYPAKLVHQTAKHGIWFAFLPASIQAPFDIEGFNEGGDLAAFRTIHDLKESGVVGTVPPRVQPITYGLKLTGRGKNWSAVMKDTIRDYGNGRNTVDKILTLAYIGLDAKSVGKVRITSANDRFNLSKNGLTLNADGKIVSGTFYSNIALPGKEDKVKVTVEWNGKLEVLTLTRHDTSE